MRIVPYMWLLNTRIMGRAPCWTAVPISWPLNKKPPTADAADDEPVGPGERRCGGRRHRIGHGPGCGPELPAGPAIGQKALRPAGEVTGVEGDDEIRGEELAQLGERPAHVERKARRRRLDGGEVFLACGLAPDAPLLFAVDRLHRGGGGGSEIRRRRDDGEIGLKNATDLVGVRVDVDE